MTVGRVIVELEAEGGSLRFVSESPDNDWCSCWLLSSGGGQRRLGAECFEALAWRLGSRLTNERSSPSGQIEGHDAYWVFSLSDGHSTLYHYPDDGGLVFIWQDSDGRVLDSRLRLPLQRCGDWHRQLNAALQLLYESAF